MAHGILLSFALGFLFLCLFGWGYFVADRSFHVHYIRTVQVRMLTEYFERIVTVSTTEIAIGCLELRMRIATSRDLRELRRLAEGEVLLETVERALLTKERRDWLTAKAASYGLKWRRVRLTVSIRTEDLDRCETFLKVKEGEHED